jgi:uncharacterized protein (DUF362 family)
MAPGRWDRPVNRRTFLEASVAAIAGSVLLAHSPVRAATQRTLATSNALGIPGPFRGRVVEVYHPDSMVHGRVEAAAVRAMVRRGMTALTGIEDPVGAWRRFFEPGDVVGIKVNPVGAPYAITSFALLHAVIDGVRSAGITAPDVIVFDRYRREFLRAGYADQLPAGVRWDTAAEAYDDAQLAIDGYDPDVYGEMNVASHRARDAKDERAHRSHVCRIVSRQITKMINLPVLKDHSFAGVTLALKNMSHGLVNNVARTHDSAASTGCDVFIPAIVSLPVIRSKVVLHIMDGTKAVFDGGPFGTPATCWSHRTLYFATDPVALDRTGWEAVDAKRRLMNLPAVADAYAPRQRDDPDSNVRAFRHPQYIALAAAQGLGEFERVQHTRIELGDRRGPHLERPERRALRKRSRRIETD